eukprot:TRINITY_DN1655_c0_g1_i1.p2 TRINITY_DN1655_c0_g1~~TRINITY_DN1655_c0_g1_i1.p2  ORF type:complete len:312 (-),score=168.02 TRINITY_DN1655_c0_g1_i1:130-1065(-)
MSKTVKRSTKWDTGIKEVTISVTVPVLPMYSKDFKRGVTAKFNPLLMKYNIDLQGVPLTYSEIQFKADTGICLVDGPPFVSFPVSAKMVVFAPSVGDRLVGRVNQIGYEHIGLVVHNLFNAKLEFKNIVGKLKRVPKTNGWTYIDSQENIQIGDHIVFHVIGMATSDDTVTISGSINEESCGKVDLPSYTNPDEVTQSQSAPAAQPLDGNAHKRTHSKFESDEEEEEEEEKKEVEIVEPEEEEEEEEIVQPVAKKAKTESKKKTSKKESDAESKKKKKTSTPTKKTTKKADEDSAAADKTKKKKKTKSQKE